MSGGKALRMNFLGRIKNWFFPQNAPLTKQERRALARLRPLLNYSIQDPKIFVQAMKHRSHLNISDEPHYQSYERLEFLGDAVLSLVAGEYLFRNNIHEDEGYLTKAKSVLVNKKTLAQRAESMGLGDIIMMSDGEDKSGGRLRPSILSDVFESIVGALYIDGGYSAAENFIVKNLLCSSDKLLREELNTNFKGDLLEFTQSRDLGVPQYIVIDAVGPEHQKEFTIEVRIKDNPYGQGRGTTKKEAEQKAASEALSKIVLELKN